MLEDEIKKKSIKDSKPNTKQLKEWWLNLI
jgi:hypothetical protein